MKRGRNTQTPKRRSDWKQTIALVVGIVGAALVVLFVLFMLFAWWCMESLPVPREDAARIQPGMTMDEVRSVLGSSRDMRSNPDGSATWYYGSPLQWSYYTVEFTKHGKVDLAQYDD